MSSGGRGRDAKARPGGGCDPLPCLPSTEAWGPFATLAAPESRSTPHRWEEGGRGEGRDSRRCHRELHSPGVPEVCLPALRQAGLSGRVEGLPHAPVTGTKAGKPFWDLYPKGVAQREKKLKVLSGANHSGQSFGSKVVLLFVPNPWTGRSSSLAEESPSLLVSRLQQSLSPGNDSLCGLEG